MKIKILDLNGFEILSIQFPLLDIDISKGRQILIRSIAMKHGLLTSTTKRKDANGIGYLEVKMRPESEKRNIEFFARQIVKELL
jgi:hypothetical protein